MGGGQHVQGFYWIVKKGWTWVTRKWSNTEPSWDESSPGMFDWEDWGGGLQLGPLTWHSKQLWTTRKQLRVIIWGTSWSSKWCHIRLYWSEKYSSWAALNRTKKDPTSSVVPKSQSLCRHNRKYLHGSIPEELSKKIWLNVIGWAGTSCLLCTESVDFLTAVNNLVALGWVAVYLLRNVKHVDLWTYSSHIYH